MSRRHYLTPVNEHTASPATLMTALSAGLNLDVMTRVATALGLTQQALSDLLGIPPRTLHRRRGEGRLKPDESERLFRYIRLLHAASATFDDDPQSAKTFLTQPQIALDGEVPVELARSEFGATRVIDVLGRIEHGVYT